ncbi:Tyrosine-protein phosphatase non-receptor type 4 [Eumeta japonica]|uniref:Tyrosine-protein phosphatase non-receptor type 4 n=1 Tax=Eumeta variegata TaxID=151549 RepID=A0A4C1Z1E3_EUMVA|nr:Tyrosine-protein phosphatase non-receptor type 4 [Eumeta japonica]
MFESVSRRAFSSSSGTYNVRASELARERKLNVFNVTVVFLDDTQNSFQIDRWLDANKSVKKQVGTNAQFWLAVRFYPPEPSRLAEEYTRYLLCLQLRKLLLDGRMSATKNTALLLASFTAQQTADDERRIRELHKLHRGQTPADAEANFLEHAKRLDCYGVESYPAKRIKAELCYSPLVLYPFPFKCLKVSSDAVIKSIRDILGSESYDTVLGFNMRSGRAAKALWRCSVERHGFFRLRAPRRRPLFGALGALAGLGAPRLTRTESQALEDARRSRSSNRAFVRRSSSRNRELSPGKLSVGAPVTALAAASRGARVTDHEELTPRAAWTDEQKTGFGLVSVSAAIQLKLRPKPKLNSNDFALGWMTLVKQLKLVILEAQCHLISLELRPLESEGGYLERALRVPLSYVDESESGEEGGVIGVISGVGGVVGNGSPDERVTVHLNPGPDGRFGFNVRGGRGTPVLVSRVAPHTRAHLQEGDQVISINGVEVEDLPHEQLVQMIRNTRGVLTLVLKPNAVYETEEPVPEEPAVCFVPLGSAHCDGDALEQSMLLLGDSLASGAALKQYETLLRKLPEESLAVSRLPQNLNKNRYRDIAPYDNSRVVLKNNPTGDYINASYINIEIPTSDLVLTYIATQGPLPSTVGDFWHMVWESESSLIVMLTVLVERGRAKCHQYWPRVGAGAMRATPSLTVSTTSEQNLGHYTRREMTLKESTSGGVRTVTQLQYTAWPDHGVPDDAAAFIQFTQLCAKLRDRFEQPVTNNYNTINIDQFMKSCGVSAVRRPSAPLSPTPLSTCPEPHVGSLQLAAHVAITPKRSESLNLVYCALRSPTLTCIYFTGNEHGFVKGSQDFFYMRVDVPTVVEELEGDKRPALNPPMIVHCSAGVGRTGALILAETALELLQRRQPVYPLDLVVGMRTQRPMCVQNAVWTCLLNVTYIALACFSIYIMLRYKVD